MSLKFLDLTISMSSSEYLSLSRWMLSFSTLNVIIVAKSKTIKQRIKSGFLEYESPNDLSSHKPIEPITVMPVTNVKSLKYQEEIYSTPKTSLRALIIAKSIERIIPTKSPTKKCFLNGVKNSHTILVKRVVFST